MLHSAHAILQGFGRPYALVRLLHSEDRLAVDESDAHALADRVRVFPRERENVGQSARRANICIREGDEPPSRKKRIETLYQCVCSADSLL